MLRNLITPQNRVIYVGDVLEKLELLPSEFYDCIVFSPPYYQAVKYHTRGEWGSENSVFEYLRKMRQLQQSLYRVLKPTGTMFVNIADTYAQHNDGPIAKGSRYGVPHRFVIQAIDDGWISENDIDWHKPNASPTSTNSHLWLNKEPLYFLAKQKGIGHYFNLDAIRVPAITPPKPFNIRVREAKKGTLNQKYGSRYTAKKHELKSHDKNGVKLQDQRGRADYIGFNQRYDHNRVVKRGKNPGEIWTIGRVKSPIRHFATFPPTLPMQCFRAGCPPKGWCLDPFMGAGSSAVAAEKLGINWNGIELKKDFAEKAIKRIRIGSIA